MTEYVLGFAFNNDLSEVVLILRNRPAWQAGKFNGLGGHVEEDETPHQAMQREFKEESGLLVRRWDHVLTMRREFAGKRFACHVFRSIFPHKSLNGLVSTCEDQAVVVHESKSLPSNVISNLTWLIPLCADLNPGDGGSYEIAGKVGEQ